MGSAFIVLSCSRAFRAIRSSDEYELADNSLDPLPPLNPIRPGLFLGAWARGGEAKVPAAHNSKTIQGIEMKFGRVAENHKLINIGEI